MHTILQILSLIVIIATVTSFFYHKVWWVRMFDFPRIQIALVSIVLLLAFLYDRYADYSLYDLALIILLLTAFCIQAYHILRFLKFFAFEVKSAERKDPELKLSILISNVLMTNRKPEKLLYQIQKYNPDLICFVETDQWWQNQLEHLIKLYPYHIDVPQEDTYGMHLFSKMELHNPKVRYLIEKDIPSIHTEFKLGSHTINASLIHPKPPAPNEAWTSKKRDMEILLMAEVIRKTQEPFILMGDLNDVAWSETTRKFKKVSGLFDPRRGRGFFNTYNAKNPFLRWPLDHVFVSHHFQLVKMKRLNFVGSDHFPIFIVLTIP